MLFPAKRVIRKRREVVRRSARPGVVRQADGILSAKPLLDECRFLIFEPAGQDFGIQSAFMNQPTSEHENHGEHG
jgi:hypothetical protein